MACDVCRSSRLLKRKRGRAPGIGIPTPFPSCVFYTLSKLSSLDRHINVCNASPWAIRFRIKEIEDSTERGYVRWGRRVRFSLARLFLFLSFSRRQIMAPPRRGEIPESSVGHPMPFFRCLSPDRMSKSVVQSPETARDLFPCVSFTLHLTFVQQ